MARRNITAEFTSLGGWLPKKRSLQRFFNRDLLTTLTVGLFTALAVFLSEHVPEQLHWFGVVMVALSNAALGVALTIWWEKSRADTRNRTEAKRIDRDIENEIQRISENWRQLIHAVSTLVGQPPPEFIRAVQFLLGNHQVYVESRLTQYALQKDQLGFNSRAFLIEKRERLMQIQADAAEVLVGTRDKGVLIDMFRQVSPAVMDKVLEDSNSPDQLN
jgi:hypothetical protein